MATYERLTPTDMQNAAFLQGSPDGPVSMLNLLRFRARAAYPRDFEGNADVTGDVAYQRYAEIASVRIDALGGRLVWGAPSFMTLVGPTNERWDAVRIVSFPTRQTYARLMEDEIYQTAIIHRQAALAETRVLICKPE